MVTAQGNLARLVRLEETIPCWLGLRAHPQTVAYVKAAASQGAHTIVITDNSLSELAGKGDITLFADIDSTFFAHSLVGPLSLVSALAGGVYARDREGFDARLRAVREQVDESGWLK